MTNHINLSEVVMENRPDLQFRRIHENIKYHFDFLFKRGFYIVSAMFIDQSNESWEVTMTAHDCLIKIYSDRGKAGLALTTTQLHDEAGLFELNDLIHLVSRDEIFFHQVEEVPTNEMQRFKRMAWLLEKHIDVILAQIGKYNPLIIHRLSFSHVIKENRTTV